MMSDSETYATFELAYALGIPVGELVQRISADEWVKWMAFFKERHRREQAAMKKARKG